MTTRTLAVLAFILVTIFVCNRITGAYFQCASPPFAFSASCFAHDVLTGEDL
jgi:hypothetical protein